MKIYSSPEKGTEIQADFIRSHIDRQPLGDIIETLVVLVTGYPEVEFVLNHNKDEKQVHWETSEINKYFGNIMRCSAKVIQFIKKELSERYKDFNE